MKHQDERFIKSREKIKRFIKLHSLPIGSYLKWKLSGYRTALGVNQALTPKECETLDTVLEIAQNDIQEIRNQLNKNEK
jgi:hypothetical protein